MRPAPTERQAVTETLALAEALGQTLGPAPARRRLLGALAAALGGTARAAEAGLPVPAEEASIREWTGTVAGWAAGAGHPDPLGWCHLVLSAANRRRAGAYYTPPAVARYLCARALAGLPDGARVLDPACGSGAFLQAAWAVAGGRIRLEGWERDPDAAAVARFNLAGTGALVENCDALSRDGGPAYDVVVGNPPYRSSGLRGLAAWPAAEQAAWIRRFPYAAEYKLNLYPLFIEQGIRLLRPGGRLAYLLPDSFLLGRYFARLRATILTGCRVLEVCLLQGDLWADARVGRSVLLILERGAPAAHHLVQVCRVQGPEQLRPEGSPAGYAQEQAAWVRTSLHRMRLFFRADDAALVTRLEAHPRVQPLRTWLRSYSGLIGRAGQRSLLRSTYPTGRVEVRRQGQVLYAGTPPPEGWRPLLASGREIDRYRVQWQGERVLLEHRLIKSGGNLALYAGPKLLLRQTADDLRAAYDDTGLFCLNNIHLLVKQDPADPHDLRYWLALLNSRLLNRYYRLVALEEGRLYPQIDLDLLGTLPLRGIDWADQAERAAHDQVVQLAAERMGAVGDAATELDRCLETAVCRLYGEADV